MTPGQNKMQEITALLFDIQIKKLNYPCILMNDFQSTILHMKFTPHLII